jgi:hypothetical protein
VEEDAHGWIAIWSVSFHLGRDWLLTERRRLLELSILKCRLRKRGRGAQVL